MKKKTTLLRRPPKPSLDKEVSSKSFLPPIKPSKRTLLTALASSNETKKVILKKTDDKTKDFDNKSIRLERSENFNDCFSVNSFNGLLCQISNKIPTNTPETKLSSVNAPEISNKSLNQNAPHKYSPKPYKPRGPDVFPRHVPKQLEELQKGVMLRKWNELVLYPNFRSSDVAFHKIPFSSTALVKSRISKSAEGFYSSKHLVDLRSIDHNNIQDFEKNDYDPNELLDAICDWNPVISFDNFVGSRKRPLIISKRSSRKKNSLTISLPSIYGRMSAPTISQHSVFVGLDPDQEDLMDSNHSLLHHEELEEVENRKEIEESYLEDDRKFGYQTNLIDINEKLNETLKSIGLSGSLRDLTQRHTIHQRQLEKKKIDAYEGRSLKGRDSRSYDRRESSVDDNIRDKTSAAVLHIDFSQLKKLPNRTPKHIALLMWKDEFKRLLTENKIMSFNEMLENKRLQVFLSHTSQFAKQQDLTAGECLKIVKDTTEEYFRGLENITQQPEDMTFLGGEHNNLSLAQMAVLSSLVIGGQSLNLKAYFISSLPDVKQLQSTLVYINISFNNFEFLPEEVFTFDKLQFIKSRDNPLRSISSDIYKLRNLRSIEVSFCCLTSLPSEIFSLENLEFLDISYNCFTNLNPDIIKLKSLRYLNLEGNQITALPCTMLHMKLHRIRTKNNFMHPAFWRDSLKISPQTLLEICLSFVEHNSSKYQWNLQKDIIDILSNCSTCTCCGKTLFGKGLSVLRPASSIWGLKNVPFTFQSCSLSCYKNFSQSS